MGCQSGAQQDCLSSLATLDLHQPFDEPELSSRASKLCGVGCHQLIP